MGGSAIGFLVGTRALGQAIGSVSVCVAIATSELFRVDSFELACASNDIEHRTTKAKHQWTNGQVERMNRTIKDATLKVFYYEDHDQLRSHLADFVAAYNFARRLKPSRGCSVHRQHCDGGSIASESSAPCRSFL